MQFIGSFETMKAVYALADRYIMPEVKEEAAFHLYDLVTIGNICELLYLADKHCDRWMKKKIWAWICQRDRLPALLKKEEFREIINGSFFQELTTMDPSRIKEASDKEGCWSPRKRRLSEDDVDVRAV